VAPIYLEQKTYLGKVGIVGFIYDNTEISYFSFLSFLLLLGYAK